jgi:hypothetical protein
VAPTALSLGQEFTDRARFEAARQERALLGLDHSQPVELADEILIGAAL